MTRVTPRSPVLHLLLCCCCLLLQSYEAVAKDICNALITLGFDAVTMPDGADLVRRLADERIELVRPIGLQTHMPYTSRWHHADGKQQQLCGASMLLVALLHSPSEALAAASVRLPVGVSAPAQSLTLC